MNFQHLKVTLPAMIGSVGASELSQAVPEPSGELINTITQILIGVLTLIGFFRNRKKQ